MAFIDTLNQAEDLSRRPATGRRLPTQSVSRLIGWLIECLAPTWLLVANLSMALLLVGALGAAYLRSIGANWLADPLFSAYSLLCSQRPSHSYFPFGSQMALEERMVAMFGAQLLGGLAVGVTRTRLRPLDWRLLILLSVPMAWDGFSQTFGWRTSDWLTRTWTGGLFGLALVWWAYPLLDRELRALQTEWRRLVRFSASQGDSRADAE